MNTQFNFTNFKFSDIVTSENKICFYIRSQNTDCETDEGYSFCTR